MFASESPWKILCHAGNIMKKTTLCNSHTTSQKVDSGLWTGLKVMYVAAGLQTCGDGDLFIILLAMSQLISDLMSNPTSQ
jgi:hypothetical protein